MTRPLSALVVILLVVGGCRPGTPCAESCEEGPADPEYTVECVDVATWHAGTIDRAEAFGTGTVLVGQRSVSEGEAASTWVGKLDSSGSLDWELELPGVGAVNALVSTSDRLHLLHRQAPAASVIDEIDPNGNLVATLPLTVGGEAVLVSALTEVDGSMVVGGTWDQDFWLARVTDDGELQDLVTQDYAGFTDTVARLTPTPDGFVATVHAGTTPGTMGAMQVQEALDTVVIFFNTDANEIHREIFSHEDEFISISTHAVASLGDGSVVVVGSQAPTLDTGDQGAWAARLSASGVVWEREWSGPEDHSTNHALAALHAVRPVDASVVVAAGRQATAEGLVRWHVLLDTDDGSDVLDALGDPAGDFNSYLAAGTDGRAWVAGSSIFSEESIQWACVFEKI